MSHPFTQTDINKFISLVQGATRIAIVSHKSPDGDSVGSSMAMYHWLKSFVPDVQLTVCHPDASPKFLHWTKAPQLILNFDEHQTEVAETINQADLIISLDFNDFSRLGKEMEALLLNSSAKKVMIDHHLEPNLNQFDLSFSYPNRCSTCELLMEIMLALADQLHIGKTVGECLYLGIVTDTGSFRYNSVRKETHEMVAMLLELGVNHTQVHEKTFDDNSLNRIKLRSFILSECLELWPDLEAAVLFLNESDAQRLNMEKGDTEGLVNIALSIQGVKIAAFFRAFEDYVRISFRSKDGAIINEIAHKYFQGGGHAQASGGRFDGSIDDAITLFKKVLNDEKV